MRCSSHLEEARPRAKVDSQPAPARSSSAHCLSVPPNRPILCAEKNNTGAAQSVFFSRTCPAFALNCAPMRIQPWRTRRRCFAERDAKGRCGDRHSTLRQASRITLWAKTNAKKGPCNLPAPGQHPVAAARAQTTRQPSFTTPTSCSISPPHHKRPLPFPLSLDSGFYFCLPTPPDIRPARTTSVGLMGSWRTRGCLP